MSKNKQPQRTKASTINASSPVFDRVEAWFENNSRILFIIISICCVVFSLLLFNAKITETNDDALYIDAGYRYAQNYFHYFYTANAPLYPMFLGVLIKLFGIKLILLKLFSVIFNYLHILFLYKALRGRLPNLIVFSVLLFAAINYMFQYFASQTYSESMYLFFQSYFLYCFANLFDSIKKNGNTIKANLSGWLKLGFVMLLLSLTKNVAVLAVAAVALVFVFYRQFLNAVYTVAIFVIFKIPFEIIKKLIWNTKGQFETQGAILALKDPYDASKGKEDLIGFVHRFFDNCDLYLAKRFFQILGFMSESSTTANGGVTVIVILLLLWGLIQILRTKNHLLLLITIYVLFMAGASFVMLQTRWDQPRIIMIFVPLMLAIIFYGIYISLRKSSSFSQWLLICPIIVVLVSGFFSSAWRAKQNIPIVKENLKGNLLFGYTTDWVNYFKMSEWCGENLPDSSMVACRKQPMSFVYGKKQIFYPVYKVFSMDADTILANFKRNKVTHVMDARLRLNPVKADGNFVNTIYRMLEIVNEKYPDKLKLVHQIPSPEQSQLEPAYLYEIKY